MIYNCYNYPNIKLKAGDLVFFKSKGFFKNNFISAILNSSSGDKNIFHVSVIVKADIGSVEIIEANPEKGVIHKEYSSLCRTHYFFTDIEVLRVNLPEDKISKAINIALNLVGSEYNDIFSANFLNSKSQKSFYCSQLIQHMFNMAALSNVFPDIPMNFKDNTGEISQFWQSYYESRSADVPQGAPGSHPSSIYESEFLTCF